jgi:hypothetical protein
MVVKCSAARKVRLIKGEATPSDFLVIGDHCTACVVLVSMFNDGLGLK